MIIRCAKYCGTASSSRETGARRIDKIVRSYGASGFTLLEVVIAVSIIAVGFTAVFSLNSQSVSAARSVEFYSKAPLLAVEKLSDIENESEQGENLNGDFGEEYPGYTWKASIAGIESEKFGEFADRLKKIDLVITLADGELTWSMTVYRYFNIEEKL